MKSFRQVIVPLSYETQSPNKLQSSLGAEDFYDGKNKQILLFFVFFVAIQDSREGVSSDFVSGAKIFVSNHLSTTTGLSYECALNGHW